MKIRYQLTLIPLEFDILGIESIHTNIQTYMSIQKRSKLIPIERISMIPIETTIIASVYLILQRRIRTS